MNILTTLLMTIKTLINTPLSDESERGDVPGWVLITLMTAALVAAIWAIAGPKLVELLNNALSAVSFV